MASELTIAALRLYRTENVGPVAFRQLTDQFGTPENALAALPELASRGGRKKPLRVPGIRDIKREITAGEALGAHLFSCQDATFSKALWACPDSPPLLWALGHSHLMSKPAIAVVGARNASANGLQLTQSLSKSLSDSGLVVISGMARGIDGAAHTGALSGISGTIAVLAGGLDHIYPKEHEALYRKIVAQGLIVTEMPPNTIAQARHFPRRNRIISGLSLGTLVVEAARRSGSLITARTSAEQGRQVFAIPGHPLDQRAQGPNDLIRNGATLVQSADDILQDISLQYDSLFEHKTTVVLQAPVTPPDTKILSEARPKIIGLLSPTPTIVDDLVRLSDCPPNTVLTVLLELELAGRLNRHAGQKVSLTTMDGNMESVFSA